MTLLEKLIDDANEVSSHIYDYRNIIEYNNKLYEKIDHKDHEYRIIFDYDDYDYVEDDKLVEALDLTYTYIYNKSIEANEFYLDELYTSEYFKNAYTEFEKKNNISIDAKLNEEQSKLFEKFFNELDHKMMIEKYINK